MAVDFVRHIQRIDKEFIAKHPSVLERFKDELDKCPNRQILRVLWKESSKDCCLCYFTDKYGEFEGCAMEVRIDAKNRENKTLVFSRYIYNEFAADKTDNIWYFLERRQKDTAALMRITMISILLDLDERGEIEPVVHSTFYALKPGRDYVYVISDLRTGYYKIGRSKNPLKREKTLQSEQPILRLIIGIEAPSLAETELHRMYKQKRVRGEWFELNREDLSNAQRFLLNYEVGKAKRKRSQLSRK